MKKTKTKKIITLIFLAILFGVGWSIFGRNEYFYNYNFGTIWGVSLFPLFLFPSGLIAAYFIYYLFFEKIFRVKNFWLQFVCFSLMYVFFLLIGETIAYYIFDVRNLGTAQYPGLPICNCLHAPRWMQTIYLIMGPVYFLSVFFVNKKLIHRA